MAAVIITRDDSIERAIDAALDLLPPGHLIPKHRVAIKPNETWAPSA
jgi:hypothetical protein